MPNTFSTSPDDSERRMSLKAYDYYRLHGYSPEQAVVLASNGQDVPEMYEQKKAVDNANSGEFRNVIGLKDEYKGTEMNQDAHDNHIERYEDEEHEATVPDAWRELLDTLIVRRIDKNAFAVETKANPNAYYIVAITDSKSRCTCAWSIFYKKQDCVHIVAAKKFMEEER